MADYWKDLTQGAPAVPQQPAGGTDYWSELTANAPSLNAATPEHAAALAKDRFDAMLKSKTDTRESGASLATIAKASLPLDIQKRIKIFAQARGIPEADYGVDSEGNIGYVDPNGGGFKLEVPTLGAGSWLKNPYDQFMRLGAQAANVAGPLSSQVAGGGAAVATPVPFLKAPAAAAIAGAVDLGRQALGNYFAGKSILDDLSLWNAGGQAALAGGGELAGAAGIAGYNRLFGRNTLRAAGHDVAALRNPQNLAQWQQLAQEARRRGITLTPGNLTNVRSLLAAERQIGRQPEGQDALYDMYFARNTQQVPDAVRAEIAPLSPTSSPALGARQFQQGAADTLDALRAQRTAAASPHYVAAFNSGVVPDIQPVLDSITNAMPATAQSSASRRVLDTAYHDLTETVTQRIGGRPVQVRRPITNYEQMHSAKEAIDNELDALEQRGFNQSEINKARAALTPIQQQLTRILRAAHPEYERGYQAFIANSPAVDQASQGLVGLAARDRQFYDAVPDLIAKGDTLSIAAARQSYEQAGQLPAWQAGVRTYLENALRDAQAVTQTGAPANVAGKFHQAVWGDQTLRANLAAAYGGGPAGRARLHTFQQLMDVLEAAARSPAEGSPTATDLAGRAGFTGRGAKVTATAVEGANPFNVPKAAGSWIRNFSQGRNIRELADIYTNDNAMRELMRLRLMRPGTQQATRLVANVLEKYGYLESPALDQPRLIPPVLSAPGRQ